MAVSITGLTWVWAALASAVLTYRLFAGWKRYGGFYMRRFSIFFALMTVAFILFGLSGFALDPFLIKLFVIFGHVSMWIGFAALIGIICMLSEKFFLERILTALVLSGGAFELYLEWRCGQLPEIVRFSGFTIVQFQFCAPAFLSEAFFIWLISIPVGIIFIQEAIKMEKESRKRPISIGLAFIVLSLAGVLSILHQPVVLLVMEDIVVIFGALAFLIGAVSMPVS